MERTLIDNCVDALRERLTPDGGFAPYKNGSYRVDSTAWSIIALDVAGFDNEIIDRARWRLTKDQQDDGRICISSRHPAAFWPTAIAIMAWHCAETFKEYQASALRFLLETSGLHLPNDQTPGIGHDTSIKGWPWIGATHSWIEPTANSIQALKLVGYQRHPRVQEGVKMILNRQFPDGGWNYGNTYVLGNKLRPMPDITGIALEALSGMTDRELVENSIIYLKDKLKNLNSPRSISWAVIGLKSWWERPINTYEKLTRCWDLQEKYGAYDSVIISQIILAKLLPEGLSNLIYEKKDQNENYK